MKIAAKDYSAAIVTIKRANDMTPKGRRDIAKWLRKQADFLEQHGKEYASRFTGRYIVPEPRAPRL